MIDSLFFDTDCISAFLWVKNESILAKLYPQGIVIPEPVYVELSRPCIAHLKDRVDTMLASGGVVIQEIATGTDEALIYYELTRAPKPGVKLIGNGEAAAISLAKAHGGIVASNNLRDIKHYIDIYSLQHITTSDILVEAFHKGLITVASGNIIWSNMLAKRRKLGADTFSDYLKLVEK